MTDNALNERLALALGWKRSEEAPRYWIAPGETEYYVHDQPDYLAPAGMLAVLEAMRTRGAVWEMVVSDEAHVKLFLPLAKGARTAQTRADTLPRAVALAALAALEGERDGNTGK